MKHPPRRHHPVGIRAVCGVLYAPADAERLSLGWCLSARGSVLYFSLVTQPWHEESRHGVVCSHSSSRVCYVLRFWWASLPKSDHMDIRTLGVACAVRTYAPVSLHAHGAHYVRMGQRDPYTPLLWSDCAKINEMVRQTLAEFHAGAARTGAGAHDATISQVYPPMTSRQVRRPMTSLRLTWAHITCHSCPRQQSAQHIPPLPQLDASAY